MNHHYSNHEEVIPVPPRCTTSVLTENISAPWTARERCITFGGALMNGKLSWINGQQEQAIYSVVVRMEEGISSFWHGAALCPKSQGEKGFPKLGHEQSFVGHFCRILNFCICEAIMQLFWKAQLVRQHAACTWIAKGSQLHFLHTSVMHQVIANNGASVQNRPPTTCKVAHNCNNTGWLCNSAGLVIQPPELFWHHSVSSNTWRIERQASQNRELFLFVAVHQEFHPRWKQWKHWS